MSPSLSSDVYPDQPVLVQVRRGGFVESVHRGAWVVCDTSGTALEGGGAFEQPVFVRSAIKSIQALPLFESGAAERFGLDDVEVALALSSHNGEDCHTEPVARLLGRIGLGPEALRCGAQLPGDSPTRRRLAASGEKPGALHNNCSGKHAGFLTLATHLEQAPDTYLEPEGATQRLVRAALGEMCDLDPEGLEFATDGCSAPTYRLGLRRLAQAFARVAEPSGLGEERRAHCLRMTRAAERHPVLIAGSRKRLCTDLLRVSQGRLFPKIGAEAVYAVGLREEGKALAVKIDDGGLRGLHALVCALLERLGWLDAAAMEALGPWRDPVLRNWAGLEVGKIEVLVP